MALIDISPSALPSPATVGLVLVVLPLAYAVTLAIYNVYFHPLSKFPGPKYAAASHLWYGIALTRGTAPKDMLRLHEQYGPVVRVAPDELSYSSPDAFKTIYGHRRAGQPELEKDKKYHAGSGGAEPVLINADREHHSMLRKSMAHGFSNVALQAQEAIIQDYLGVMVSKLNEQGRDGGVALDMHAWYNYFTFDVIGYLTYGESFGCLTSSGMHTWVSLTLGLVEQMAYSQACRRFPKLLQLPYAMHYVTRDIKNHIKTSDELTEAKIKWRIENPPSVPDFMGKLIETHEAGKLSFKQLMGNSTILMVAGSETTATLLAGVTHLLMTNPGPLARLTDEIRSSFSSPDEITMVGVNKCKYLLAALEEALRMYPPSPATHPRYTPPEGITIDGVFVPGNMAVGVTILAAAQSSANFFEPARFMPERWIDKEEDPRFAADRRDAVQPFSYGPRNCIGRNLAYVEMKLVIARLLWHFDLEGCSRGEDWIGEQKIHMVWQKGPLMVKLHPVRREL